MMTLAEFRKTDGFECPKCEGRNTAELEPPTDCMGDVTWDIECNDCGCAYRVQFKIDKYTIISEGD